MAEELNEALLAHATKQKKSSLQSHLCHNYVGMREYGQALMISESIEDKHERNSIAGLVVQGFLGDNKYDNALKSTERIDDKYYKSMALYHICMEYLRISNNEYAFRIANTIPDINIRNGVLSSVLISYSKTADIGKTIRFMKQRGSENMISYDFVYRELHKALMKEADDCIEKGMKAEAIDMLVQACQLFGRCGFASVRDSYAADIACRYAVLYEFEKAMELADGSSVALAKIGFLFLEKGIEPDYKMQMSLKDIITNPRLIGRCGN